MIAMDPEVTQSVNLGREVRERKYKTTVTTLLQNTKRTLFYVLIGDLQNFFSQTDPVHMPWWKHLFKEWHS